MECTDWARQILTRSHAAATRFDPSVRIRVATTAGSVQAVLADGPEPGDTEFAIGDFAVLIEEGLDGLLDCTEPHDQLVLRPAGSTPNAHEH